VAPGGSIGEEGGMTDRNDAAGFTWDELKQEGSDHYKTGGVEPIDLYRAITPHPSHSAFAVKALADCIKYAARQLTRGYSPADTDKMIHYLRLLRAERE
jgi:hypothetical protein